MAHSLRTVAAYEVLPDRGNPPYDTQRRVRLVFPNGELSLRWMTRDQLILLAKEDVVKVHL